MGRPPGPTAQGALSREVIIDAAAGVFARLGYDRARMADVVQASRLSKGSVYFHFDSKETLAVAVLTARHDKWITAVQQLLDRHAPGVARLRALLPAMLELHRSDPDAWVISRLSQALAELEPTRETVATLTNRWIDLVATVIRDASPDPHHLRIDAVAMATVLVGAFDGTKATIDIISTDREQDLGVAGALLERMLLTTLALHHHAEE